MRGPPVTLGPVTAALAVEGVGMHGRFASLSILALTTSTLCVAVPHIALAQPAGLNAKQRWLAGEPLPVNAAAAVQALRDAQAAAPRQRFVPGRLLVKLADGVTESSLSALAARTGARSVSRRPFADFIVMTIDADRDVEATAREVAAQPGVVYAEPVWRRYAMYTPNDPLYHLQWNFQKLDMERTWDINRGAASSLVVAVIDSGVAYTTKGPTREAPDLEGQTFVSPHDFIWDDDTPVDLDGHGTHVTGTIAQRTGNDLGVAGMAFNVSIMPVKVLSGPWDEIMGAPNVGTSETLAQALRYAADNGAKVMNLSLGGDGESDAERDAINYAISKGAVVLVAGGNSGETGSPDSFPAAFAADIKGLVAVAALDLNLQRAVYSNSNPYVEIAAPGGDVFADLNNDGYGDGVIQQTLDPSAVDIGIFDEFGYFFFEGTSMATPHVAGLAALLMTQGVTDPKAVEAVIERFATDIGPTGRDNDTGFGVINPRATIRGLGISK
jgi:serine protease